MGTYNNLPVYTAEINEADEGMVCISLVDEPATMSNFMAFDKVKELLKYSVEDDDKRIVFGMVMAANLPIYRYSEDVGEYYIIYQRDTIAKMAQKYLKEKRQNNVDTQHNFNYEDGIEMRQIFIKDSEAGISPKGFEDYADGSLFAEFKIENDDIWNDIKEGKYKGFSLAGTFDVIPTSKNEEFNKVNKKDSIMSKLLNAFVKLLVKFGKVETDKGVLIWTGDEDLKEGDEIFVEDENGEMVAPEDGDYKVQDDKTITVKDGKVEKIVDEKAEVATEEKEEKEDEKFSIFKTVAKFESQSYQEKEAKIARAIIDEDEYAYLVEAGDDYCVIASYLEDGEHFFKYEISWDGDEVVVGKSIEVVQAFVPLEQVEDDKDAEIAKKDEEIEDLKKQIEDLKKEEPAPIAEEFKNITKEKTGNKKLDTLCNNIQKANSLWK